MINGSRGRALTLLLGIGCLVLAGAVAMLPVAFRGVDVSGLQHLEDIFLGLFVGAVSVSPTPAAPKSTTVTLQEPPTRQTPATPVVVVQGGTVTGSTERGTG